MDEKLSEKIAQNLSKKLLSPKEDSALEKVKIYAGVVASLATLTASILAFLASQQALSVQATLDKRQLLLDEQARIGAIYFKTKTQVICAAIPLDEVKAWGNYRACMFGEGHRYNENLSFLDAPDQTQRITCLIKVDYCR